MQPLLLRRECFHLHFLKHLAARLAARPYAVKGGICLRFFYRSPRFSEDMDLDVASSIPTSTLANAVDGILGNRSFASALAGQGITGLEFSKPKQTDTTQRWKVSLQSQTGPALSTKIEFSKRQGKIQADGGMPEASFLHACQIPSFAARYYNAASLAEQKIRALISPSRNAARDLFDLHHLIYQIKVKPADIAPRFSTADLEKAAEKAGAFSHSQFKEEVLPFLPESLIELYENRSGFEPLRSTVEDALLGVIS